MQVNKEITLLMKPKVNRKYQVKNQVSVLCWINCCFEISVDFVVGWFFRGSEVFGRWLNGVKLENRPKSKLFVNLNKTFFGVSLVRVLCFFGRVLIAWSLVALCWLNPFLSSYSHYFIGTMKSVYVKLWFFVF